MLIQFIKSHVHRLSPQLLFSVLLLGGLPSIGLAAGSSPWLVSANSLGDVGAGIAATADNPDTSYYNPAGSPFIQYQEMGFSGLSVINTATFTGQTTLTPSLSGFPARGNAQGGEVFYLPDIFYVAPISQKIGFGFSISSPYEFAVDYGSDSLLRYALTQSSLDTIDIGPSFGIRLRPALSIGVGVNMQHADFQLKQASPVLNTPTSGWSTDNFGSWGVGWNTGLLWQALSRTRLGFSYHSLVHQNGSGSSTFSAPDTALYSRDHTDYDLPAMSIASVEQNLSAHWNVLGSVQYTQWSQLNTVTLKNVALGSGIQNETLVSGLHNSWVFSVGNEYQLTPRLQLKGGVAYDESNAAAADQNLIFYQIPHYTLGVGAHYQMTKNVNVELGYNHNFSHSVNINTTQTNNATSNSQGQLTTASDIIGIQLNWKMT